MIMDFQFLYDSLVCWLQNTSDVCWQELKASCLEHFNITMQAAVDVSGDWQFAAYSSPNASEPPQAWCGHLCGHSFDLYSATLRRHCESFLCSWHDLLWDIELPWNVRLGLCKVGNVHDWNWITNDKGRKWVILRVHHQGQMLLSQETGDMCHRLFVLCLCCTCAQLKVMALQAPQFLWRRWGVPFIICFICSLYRMCYFIH